MDDRELTTLIRSQIRCLHCRLTSLRHIYYYFYGYNEFDKLRPNKAFIYLSVCKRAEFNKPCILIGSSSGQNFSYFRKSGQNRCVMSSYTFREQLIRNLTAYTIIKVPAINLDHFARAHFNERELTASKFKAVFKLVRVCLFIANFAKMART